MIRKTIKLSVLTADKMLPCDTRLCRICKKRKWLALSRLNQKVLDAGGTSGNYVFRDPHASRSKADT